MNTEERIAQVNNAQEFVRLCNALLSAEYGHGYQVVDGSRGDDGNDGYVASEERLLAIYCPIKPESRTDKHFRDKIDGDLAKATSLRDRGAMRIARWTFITPRKLSNSVLLTMYEAAAQFGLTANHQESTYLANLLVKHKAIIQEFPWLHVVDISAQLSTIIKMLGDKQHEWQAPEETRPLGTISPETKNPTEDAQEVRNILANPIDEKGKSRLRGIVYRSTDPVAQLEAIGALLIVRDVTRDSDADMIELCDLAINLADHIPAPSCKAEVISYKGVFYSDTFAREYIHYVMSARADLSIGFPVISQEEHRRTLDRLEWLRKQLNEHFTTALNLAQELNDPDCIARVLLHVGDSAGRRFIMLCAAGDAEQATYQRKLCKQALMTAKNLFAAIGQEVNVAHALHNLANQLRFFGEIEEAKCLTVDVLALAEKHGDFRLKYLAGILMNRLETGEMPDYTGGSDEIPKKI